MYHLRHMDSGDRAFFKRLGEWATKALWIAPIIAGVWWCIIKVRPYLDVPMGSLTLRDVGDIALLGLGIFYGIWFALFIARA